MSKIAGPVSGGAHGWPLAGYFGDIALQGYIEEDFFLSGPQGDTNPCGNSND